jgi:Heparinase II/III-like protein
VEKMLKKIGKKICVLLLMIPILLNAQISKEELMKAININELQHPYLFFSNGEKQVLQDRIKNVKECKNIWESLLAKGHRYLNMPLEKTAPQQAEHPRYTFDDPETDYITELREGALTLAFLYQMTGDIKYANRAIEFAIAICNLKDWVEAAHKFDIIYPRVWPWNVPDDRVVFSYDIFAAGKALTVATVYDWVYPALTKYERDKIRNGLLEDVITRVRGNYDFFWWSTAYRCNWDAICFSGLGVAALTLLKENPQIVDVIAEAYNRINLTFDHIGEDGGWQEGTGYYGYMMRESVLFMEALKRTSNGKYNLFNHKKIKDHPVDFLLYALTANFGDSGGEPVGSTNMVNKLVEETGNSTGSWYRNQFLGEGDDVFDIIWSRPKIKPVEPDRKSKFFRGINWAIMRSDFLDPSTVTIATKAGYNDDPHHGHLDIGQFILTYQSVPFIRDLGRMRYDEFYFNEDRFDYPQASSKGHNVIFVNGEEQIIAKKKDKPWKEGIGGKILDFQTSEKQDYVLMDPTKAYPNKELKKWRRSIILEKPVITLVFDEVESNPGAEIEARFYPGVGIERESRRNRISERNGEYEVNNNFVYLSDGKKHNMVLIPLVLDNDFEIIKDKIPSIAVTEDPAVTWFEYFETVTKAKSNTSIIAAIILPVKDKEGAENIVKSAKINQAGLNEIKINITNDSKEYEWSFTKTKDGFVYEYK